MSQDEQKALIDGLRAQVSQMLAGLDQEAPIAAIVLFTVNAAKEKTFAKNNEVLSEATRRLPGCNVYAYHKRRPPAEGEPPRDNPEYIIYEDWETVRQFRRQWGSQHLKKFQYSVLDFIVGPPDLRWYYGWSDKRADERGPESSQEEWGERSPESSQEE